jgi:RND family efflux transporter MFP subunit
MKRLAICIWVGTITLALLSGCSQEAKEEQAVKIPVEVMTVKTGTVVQSITFNGDIRAELDVKVFSKIPDRIEKYFVEEGDFVPRGGPVARIYAATIEQAVRQAEAGLAAAKAQEANVRVEYERAQRLLPENALSKQQFDMVQTQYEAAKAGLEQAQAAVASIQSTLDDATVTAPIAGIISKRYYEAGDMANPVMPVVSIVQMDRVKITFEATENDLGMIRVGNEATVSVKSYPNEKFSGKVTKISPVLDPLTRMASVEVQVDNRDRALKPGMFGQIQVKTGALENVMVVPRFATIESTSMETVQGEDQVVTNYFVFVVNGDKAEQRKLITTYVNHVQLAVSSGIKLGEKVVTAGQANLRDGAVITVVKEDAAL